MPNHSKRWDSWTLILAAVILVLAAKGQTTSSTVSLHKGGSLITPQDLLPGLFDSLQAMGGRFLESGMAQMTLIGTVTDSSGTRNASITVQAPTYLAYREGQSRAITFNGTQFQTKGGQLTSADEPVAESRLAHLPDAIYLQLAYAAPRCIPTEQATTVTVTSQANPSLAASAPVTVSLPVDQQLTNQTIGSASVSCGATNSITASSGYSVSGSGTVLFQRGNYIQLKPGFTAVGGGGGTTFQAKITSGIHQKHALHVV